MTPERTWHDGRHGWTGVIGMGSRRFIGGMRGSLGGYATWPLVELTLCEGEGRLRVRVPLLRSFFRPWFPDFEFDTATVEAAPQRGARGPGVRFARPDGKSVIFYTFSSDEVLA